MHTWERSDSLQQNDSLRHRLQEFQKKSERFKILKLASGQNHVDKSGIGYSQHGLSKSAKYTNSYIPEDLRSPQKDFLSNTMMINEQPTVVPVSRKNHTPGKRQNPKLKVKSPATKRDRTVNVGKIARRQQSKGSSRPTMTSIDTMSVSNLKRNTSRKGSSYGPESLVSTSTPYGDCSERRDDTLTTVDMVIDPQHDDPIEESTQIQSKRGRRKLTNTPKQLIGSCKTSVANPNLSALKVDLFRKSKHKMRTTRNSSKHLDRDKDHRSYSPECDPYLKSVELDLSLKLHPILSSTKMNDDTSKAKNNECADSSSKFNVSTSSPEWETIQAFMKYHKFLSPKLDLNTS